MLPPPSSGGSFSAPYRIWGSCSVLSCPALVCWPPRNTTGNQNHAAGGGVGMLSRGLRERGFGLSETSTLFPLNIGALLSHTPATRWSSNLGWASSVPSTGLGASPHLCLSYTAITPSLPHTLHCPVRERLISVAPDLSKQKPWAPLPISHQRASFLSITSLTHPE